MLACNEVYDEIRKQADPESYFLVQPVTDTLPPTTVHLTAEGALSKSRRVIAIKTVTPGFPSQSKAECTGNFKRDLTQAILKISSTTNNAGRG